MFSGFSYLIRAFWMIFEWKGILLFLSSCVFIIHSNRISWQMTEPNIHYLFSYPNQSKPPISQVCISSNEWMRANDTLGTWFLFFKLPDGVFSPWRKRLKLVNEHHDRQNERRDDDASQTCFKSSKSRFMGRRCGCDRVLWTTNPKLPGKMEIIRFRNCIPVHFGI